MIRWLLSLFQSDCRQVPVHSTLQASVKRKAYLSQFVRAPFLLSFVLVQLNVLSSPI